MCNNDEKCMAELLEKILILQKANDNNQNGCDKPFLGGNTSIINIIPINLYTCCDGNICSMLYDHNGESGESTTFRIENINDNYATFRILIPTNDGYVFTNNFFTIDLKSISCIKCLTNLNINNI